MPPTLFADGAPDRLTRYRVIAFVCFIIIAGAWSIAYSQSARIFAWQWDTLAALTVVNIVVFFRWFRFGRTTVLGLLAAGLSMALM
ncbi:MAG: hypothetical protein ABR584_11560, partial [Candidatus Baltobacteraceae bacterium]